MREPKVELSIIIVGYNAIEFLKLTLDSVSKAIEPIHAEVILIDNSNNQLLQDTVRQLYPFVTILPNTDNLGFARANNLGLKAAQGKRALLLNPDTIVAEDTFIKINDFYTQHPHTGGLGVKMVNGNGQYLKESKRGFPGVQASLYKLIGLHQPFPQSKRLARYYLGHLDKHSRHFVDILSGAFLVIPRDNSNELTLLDEAYFMYGEDIDLSWRLKQQHGANVYFPNTTIIHFKGQSTLVDKKILWHFYNAMWLFYKQHLYHQNYWFTNAMVWFSIKAATYLRTLFTYLPARKPQGTTCFDFTSARLISSNSALLQSIEKALKVNISLSQIDSPPESGEQLSIFDFNEVSYKDAIETIEKNPGKYAFITKDSKSLVICTQSTSKGQVIHLK